MSNPALWRQRVLVLPLAILVSLCVGQSEASTEGAAWPLRFAADFTTDFDKRFPVGNEWVVLGGKWDMENGMLQGRGPNGLLMCKRSFRSPLRVEYECRSDEPCDLSLVLRTNLEPKRPKGYHFGFGAYNNTFSVIAAAPGGELGKTTSTVIQPGKLHHVVVELTDREVRWSVDGKLALSAPARTGLSVRHFGLYVWNSGSFDNVRVYSPNEPTGAVTTQKTEVRYFRGFNDEPVAQPPRDCKVEASKDSRVRVVDVPTWVYDSEDPAASRPSYGLFYMAIDTDTRLGRSASSIDRGKTFSSDSLRAGYKPAKSNQGELMVRLAVTGLDGQVATAQHDDGKHESHWGTASSPGHVVRKTLRLDLDPSRPKAARLRYLMAGDPHHPVRKRAFSRSVAGVEWANMLIWVNDEVAARGSPMELGTKGWHEITVDPCLLVEGDNRVDFTWEEILRGEHFVSDPCLEFFDEDADPGQIATAAFGVPQLKAGLVQFDVMADWYEGEALRVLIGTDVGLVIGPDGSFHYEAGGERKKLLDTVRFPNVPGDGSDFRLRPGRWYTIRIDFDCPNGLANLAVVGLYNTARTSKTVGLAEYLVLGQDLPMPLRAVNVIRFETAQKGRFLVDNLFAVSRTEALSADASWRVPAQRIVKAELSPRRDPFTLLTYSLRNIYQRKPQERTRPGPEYNRLRRGEHPTILDCARQYNELLLEQAFVAEQLQELRRAHFHLSRFAGVPGAAYAKQVAAVARLVAQTERDLDDAHRFYAACYLDRLNEERLKKGIGRRAERLRRQLMEVGAQMRGLLVAMRRDASRFGPTLDVPRDRLRIDQGPTEFSEGAFRRNGRPVLLPCQRGDLPFPGQNRLLGLGQCYPSIPVHPMHVHKATEPDLVYHPRTVFSATRGSLGRPDPGRTVSCSFGYWIGSHRCHSVAPKWWLDKRRTDPDLFLRGPDGEHADQGELNVSLNFWHPKVRKLHADLCKVLTAETLAHYQGRVWFGSLAAEGFLCGASKEGRFETGYNQSAIKAFRHCLVKTYGTAAALNATWRTDYASFDAIEPPPSAKRVPRRQPMGLTYEWARFRQDSWHEWMELCMGAVREERPGLPFASYLSVGYFFGTDYISGFDPVKVFETFDIVADHGRLFVDNMVPNCRMLDSLRKACGKCTGNLEWGAYPFSDIFDERDVKLGALRHANRMISWGDTVIEYWYGTSGGWAETANWTDPRLGHTLFRYSSAYIPLSMARANANADVFFECPTVEPDVAILESQTSFYNAHPPYIVRSAMRSLAELLEAKGHNYGFLFEALLLDGRQSLTGRKVILLPHGVTLPDAMAEQLEAWVRDGGVLIALGPPGLYSPHGAPRGKLLSAAFGNSKWTRDPKRSYWRVEFGREPKYPYPSDGRFFLAEARLGRGVLYVANACPTVLLDTIYGIVRTCAPRTFFARGHKFELILRQGPDCQFLSICNATPKEQEDEIVLRRSRATIMDRDTGFAIATNVQPNEASFRLRLGPAECMVARIGD